jgi:hypothetical protein
MKTMILLIGILCLSVGYQAKAQAIAELRQYTTGGKVDAEIVTIEPDRRWTAYGKTTLTVSGDKLVGSFWQSFSDRNRFAGDKDNTGIEINLNTGEITCILYTWGSGRDQYPASVQAGGKLLVGRRGQTMLVVSLGQPKP